jgi:hypothetical protein
MATNPAADTLTADEALHFQTALDKYEPKDVHDALDGIDEAPLDGSEASTAASGPLVAGDGGPGVEVGTIEGGRVRLRVAYTDMSGAVYDELEMPAARFRGLVAKLLAFLEAEKAPRYR